MKTPIRRDFVFNICVFKGPSETLNNFDAPHPRLKNENPQMRVSFIFLKFEALELQLIF